MKYKDIRIKIYGEKMKKSTFGEIIREKRLECGLSQFQLGRLLNVSDKAVSKWENNLAKPKSILLYRLCSILGITIDELYIGENNDNVAAQSFTKMQKQILIHKAHNKLMELFSQNPPIEAVNRFETEKMTLMDSDVLYYFDLIAKIKEMSLKRNSPILVRGGIGASFIAYLLGASDINPLQPHYYCPVCKKIEFVSSIYDCWDLEEKYCEKCKKLLVRDGHDIPFDVYRHAISKNIGFDIMLGQELHEDANKIIMQYFNKYQVEMLQPSSEIAKMKLCSSIITYIVVKEQEKNIFDMRDTNCTYEAYQQIISEKMYINLLFDDEYEKFIFLEKAQKGTNQINVKPNALLNIDLLKILMQDTGIVTDKIYSVIEKQKVKNFKDILKLLGIILCASSLTAEEQEKYLNKIMNKTETITYRDEVYQQICFQLHKAGYYDFGIAFMVMDRARKGVYYQNGMDKYTRDLLLDIGMNENYIESLTCVPYLFPKTQGIVFVRRLRMLSWYKEQYPVEFKQIFQNNQ